MGKLIRLRNKEQMFLENINPDPHLAFEQLIKESNKSKLEKSEYWELKTEINKLKEKLEKLQDFIDTHAGY